MLHAMHQQVTDPALEAEGSEGKDCCSSMPPLELIEDFDEEEPPIVPPLLHTYPPGWLHLLVGIAGGPFPSPEVVN